MKDGTPEAKDICDSIRYAISDLETLKHAVDVSKRVRIERIIKTLTADPCRRCDYETKRPVDEGAFQE